MLPGGVLERHGKMTPQIRWWMSPIPEEEWNICNIESYSYSCVGATCEFWLELFVFLVYQGSGPSWYWCFAYWNGSSKMCFPWRFSEFHPWGGQRRHWHAKGRAGSKDSRVTTRGKNRMGKQNSQLGENSSVQFWLSQWLTFKLLGIAYFIGKIQFKLLFHGPLAE